MAVNSDVIGSISYIGDGSQVDWTVTFVYSVAADLIVIDTDTGTGIETILVEGADYTVTGGGGDPGVPAVGTVTTTDPIASGHRITIKRSLPLLQPLTLAPNTALPSVSLMYNLDRTTLQIQDLAEELSRSIVASVGSGVSNLTVAQPQAGYFLRFNPDTPTLIDGISPTAAMVASALTGGNGVVVQTDASGTFAARTITAGTGISVGNGDGVAANPTVAIAGATLSTISGAAQKASNLSDIASPSTALTNLGGLAIANNLSDLNSASTARTNLGLGTSATHAVGDFLQGSNNLSEILSQSTARTNLGLGTASTHNVGDFMQASANLSDLADDATARSNLGLGNVSVKNISDGSVNQVLTTDGAGAWSFAALSAVGGSYTAGTGISIGSNIITSSLAAGLLNSLALGGNAATVGDLKLYNTGGTFYSGFKAPALAANVQYTLPTADGTTGQVLSTDGSKVLSWTTASSGAGSTANITQSAHGFAVGNVLKLSAADTYAKAQADSVANAEVIGIVSAVIDTNNFTLQMGGRITGLSALTANTVYFLDPSSAGAITATEPSTAGQISKPVLITSSTTAGYVNIMRGITIGTALSAASSSDVVTGTSTSVYVTPAVIKNNPGVAKASVQWTVGGTTTNYTNNVSSISRTGNGDYTVNLTSNLANTTDMRVYCGFISASTMLAWAVNALAVGSARVQIRNAAGTVTDPSGNIWVDIFGTF